MNQDGQVLQDSQGKPKRVVLGEDGRTIFGDMLQSVLPNIYTIEIRHKKCYVLLIVRLLFYVPQIEPMYRIKVFYLEWLDILGRWEQGPVHWDHKELRLRKLGDK